MDRPTGGVGGGDWNFMECQPHGFAHHGLTPLRGQDPWLRRPQPNEFGWGGSGTCFNRFGMSNLWFKPQDGGWGLVRLLDYY
ncbi:MAG TPA: hypothetical protein VK856_05275 [Anaerolineaceae bacterium]|nr:hypothetical protein [Anaerolineaceae bacterium]